MLKLRHVSKTYGSGATEVHALRDIALSVEPGMLVAVMGPQGSGKSTLLAVAGGLEPPSSGEVLMDGMHVSAMCRGTRARLRRRSIGYVFQDFNLLPGLTAAENVALPLELDGYSGRKARIAAMRALDELDLTGQAGRLPGQLIAGERQRVALARAMASERRLLVADEPTGALDSLNGEAIVRMVRNACKRGMAAVMVTHDARFAAAADRVLFLRGGRVADQTAPLAGPESLLGPVHVA
jgi:putative ABC transport system ATP-binding protein